jgi:hypothetical protein
MSDVASRQRDSHFHLVKAHVFPHILTLASTCRTSFVLTRVTKCTLSSDKVLFTKNIVHFYVGIAWCRRQYESQVDNVHHKGKGHNDTGSDKCISSPYVLKGTGLSCNPSVKLHKHFWKAEFNGREP